VIDARCVCGAHLNDGRHIVTDANRVYRLDPTATRRSSGGTAKAATATHGNRVTTHEEVSREIPETRR